MGSDNAHTPLLNPHLLVRSLSWSMVGIEYRGAAVEECRLVRGWNHASTLDRAGSPNPCVARSGRGGALCIAASTSLPSSNKEAAGEALDARGALPWSSTSLAATGITNPPDIARRETDGGMCAEALLWTSIPLSFGITMTERG